MSRREFLGAAALASGGAAAGFGAGRHSVSDDDSAGDRREDVVSFDGEHQTGITTPQQTHLLFAAFEIMDHDARALESLLISWTEAARQLTEGRARKSNASVSETAVAPSGGPAASPKRLTLTFGFGPAFFQLASVNDRFASFRPRALIDLPAFQGDQLDPEHSGGTLCVQACADDRQVAFNAVRALAALGRGTVVTQWIQNGFRRTADSSEPLAGRNLFGFQDGVNNLDADDEELMSDQVWVGDDDAESEWMRGGTYLG